jgi:hypothetical protein
MFHAGQPKNRSKFYKRIHHSQYTIYDLGFTIFRIYVHDSRFIHHPHSHPINFQKHLRKSAQAIRENQPEIKKKNTPQETRKNKKLHIRFGVNLFAYFASLKNINKR